MWPCIAMVKNNIFHIDDCKAHFDSLPDKFAWMDGRIRWFVVLGKETNVLLRAARERKLWRVMISHIVKNTPHGRSRPVPNTLLSVQIVSLAFHFVSCLIWTLIQFHLNTCCSQLPFLLLLNPVNAKLLVSWPCPMWKSNKTDL